MGAVLAEVTQSHHHGILARYAGHLSGYPGSKFVLRLQHRCLVVSVENLDFYLMKRLLFRLSEVLSRTKKDRKQHANLPNFGSSSASVFLTENIVSF